MLSVKERSCLSHFAKIVFHKISPFNLPHQPENYTHSLIHPSVLHPPHICPFVYPSIDRLSICPSTGLFQGLGHQRWQRPGSTDPLPFPLPPPSPGPLLELGCGHKSPRGEWREPDSLGGSLAVPGLLGPGLLFCLSSLRARDGGLSLPTLPTQARGTVGTEPSAAYHCLSPPPPCSSTRKVRETRGQTPTLRAVMATHSSQTGWVQSKCFRLSDPVLSPVRATGRLYLGELRERGAQGSRASGAQSAPSSLAYSSVQGPVRDAL